MPGEVAGSAEAAGGEYDCVVVGGETGYGGLEVVVDADAYVDGGPAE